MKRRRPDSPDLPGLRKVVVATASYCGVLAVGAGALSVWASPHAAMYAAVATGATVCLILASALRRGVEAPVQGIVAGLRSLLGQAHVSVADAPELTELRRLRLGPGEMIDVERGRLHIGDRVVRSADALELRREGESWALIVRSPLAVGTSRQAEVGELTSKSFSVAPAMLPVLHWALWRLAQRLGASLATPSTRVKAGTLKENGRSRLRQARRQLEDRLAEQHADQAGEVPPKLVLPVDPSLYQARRDRLARTAVIAALTIVGLPIAFWLGWHLATVRRRAVVTVAPGGVMVDGCWHDSSALWVASALPVHAGSPILVGPTFARLMTTIGDSYDRRVTLGWSMLRLLERAPEPTSASPRRPRRRPVSRAGWVMGGLLLLLYSGCAVAMSAEMWSDWWELTSAADKEVAAPPHLTLVWAAFPALIGIFVARLGLPWRWHVSSTHLVLSVVPQLLCGVVVSWAMVQGDLRGLTLPAGTDLSGADVLSARDLSRAQLSSVRLSGADLRAVDLRMANVSRADLVGAKLFDADLRSSHFAGANLSGASLDRADLRRARLHRADLRQASLVGADLRRADLREADLRDANLRGADLRGATLTDTLLEGADLRGARR